MSAITLRGSVLWVSSYIYHCLGIQFPVMSAHSSDTSYGLVVYIRIIIRRYPTECRSRSVQIAEIMTACCGLVAPDGAPRASLFLELFLCGGILPSMKHVTLLLLTPPPSPQVASQMSFTLYTVDLGSFMYTVHCSHINALSLCKVRKSASFLTTLHKCKLTGWSGVD